MNRYTNVKNKTKKISCLLWEASISTPFLRKDDHLSHGNICVRYQGINWMKCQKQTHINRLDSKFEMRNHPAALTLWWWTHTTLCTAVKFMVVLGCCPDGLSLPFLLIWPGIPPHLQGVTVSFGTVQAPYGHLWGGQTRDILSHYGAHIFLSPCLF